MPVHLFEGYANCKSGREVIEFQNQYLERIEQERTIDRSLDVGQALQRLFCSYRQLTVKKRMTRMTMGSSVFTV